MFNRYASYCWEYARKERIVMFRVYRMYRGVRFEVGTFESEKRASEVVARKAKYGKYCFIARI